MLVPVKAFSAAKQRLAGVLAPDERSRLARWMADRVVAAVGEIAVFVVCDDVEVRSWAVDRGAHVLWTARLGLNGAVDDGVEAIATAGYDHVVVAHADLVLPAGLVRIVRAGTTTLVPDRRRDGTNVMAFPTSHPVAASYGPGSFDRHRRSAGPLPIEIRIDTHLSIDVDTPSDLTHPLLKEVLPPWLPTIPVNPFIHRA